MKGLSAILTIALLSLSCATAWAKKPVYQDGVLKDFNTAQDGTSCSTDGNTTGTVRAHTDDDGNTRGTLNANTTASTLCGSRIRAYYTVVVGNHTFVLTPTSASPISAGKLFIPYGVLFMKNKNSVLYGLLPGTPIQMGTKDRSVYVKVGKDESEYTIISMQSSAPDPETPSPPNIDIDQTIPPDTATKPIQEAVVPIAIPIGQLNSDQQRAVEQLRAIAEIIKKCPGGVNPDSDTSFGSHFSAPMNVVWDVERTQSYRSPLIGYIEFISDSTYPVEKSVQCKNNDRKCIAWNQAIAETNMEISDLPTIKLNRYEFDFGDNGLEFTRALRRLENEDNSHWNSAQLGNGCEGQAVLGVVK